MQATPIHNVHKTGELKHGDKEKSEKHTDNQLAMCAAVTPFFHVIVPIRLIVGACILHGGDKEHRVSDVHAINHQKHGNGTAVLVNTQHLAPLDTNNAWRSAIDYAGHEFVMTVGNLRGLEHRHISAHNFSAVDRPDGGCGTPQSKANVVSTDNKGVTPTPP